MVSTGFGFGERETIANAYAKMYAPRRRINEDKNYLDAIEALQPKEDLIEIEGVNPDEDVATIAGYADVDFNSATNNPSYQINKQISNKLLDKAEKSKRNKERLDYLNKADEYAGKAVDGVVDRITKKTGAKPFKNNDWVGWRDSLHPVDRENMRKSGFNGYDFNSGTNDVNYQVNKAMYNFADNLADRIDYKNHANDAFDKSKTDNLEMVKLESCNCDDGCCCGKGKKTLKKLPTEHKIPSKTGSKLGKRKVLPFAKRDAKSSAKKYAPKVKKIVESNRFFCITDGNKVLCTNDIGESYFNRGGISGETRIYESKMSAIKDVQKIKSRRNPNSKYKVRACECVGESVQFADQPYGRFVNEGLWDAVTSLGSGALNAAKAVGNVAGGVAKGAGNLLQGNVSQAGSDLWGGVKGAGGNLKDAAVNVADTATNTLNTAGDAVQSVGSATQAAGNLLQGNLQGAKSNLADAGNSLLGSTAGDKTEDVTNAASKAGGAIASGAKAAGNALLNGAKGGANILGSGLKAVGNLAQGNFKEAWNNVSGGDKQNPANPNANPANPNANAGAGQQGQQGQQGQGGDKEAQKKQIQDQIAKLQQQLQALGN